MSRFLRILCLLVFGAFTAFTVNADDTVTYTFEAPQFTAFETTPILNRSPNVGSPAFQASFTSEIANGYLIIRFPVNPLLTEHFLSALCCEGEPNLLTISFNKPVNQVQFAWGQFAPGRIVFASSAGNLSQNSASFGSPLFPGGTFSFSSVNSFTSFTLSAFDFFGFQTPFSIDNLTLTTPTNIPEPPWGPETPNFNLEVILRGEGFGLVKFRQPNDNFFIVNLDVWLRDLTPNTSYLLQRAVDTAVDDNCTSTDWLTLGKGSEAQSITTDDNGTGREKLFRILPPSPGLEFDIHFQVIEEETGKVVLTSKCYQFTISQ